MRLVLVNLIVSVKMGEVNREMPDKQRLKYFLPISTRNTGFAFLFTEVEKNRKPDVLNCTKMSTGCGAAITGEEIEYNKRNIFMEEQGP